jgi:toxin ParE1/3/4
MPSYKFAPSARAELRKIIAYINEESEPAAERWFEKLQKKCDTLAHSPKIGRIREDITPELHMFPYGDYLIFYDIVSAGIQVIHIIHGMQDVRGMFAEARGGEQ